MAAHPDLDLLTLLYQQPSLNGVPSLQARLHGGTWIDVPPVVRTVTLECIGVLLYVAIGTSNEGAELHETAINDYWHECRKAPCQLWRGLHYP